MTLSFVNEIFAMSIVAFHLLVLQTILLPKIALVIIETSVSGYLKNSVLRYITFNIVFKTI